MTRQIQVHALWILTIVSVVILVVCWNHAVGRGIPEEL